MPFASTAIAVASIAGAAASVGGTVVSAIGQKKAGTAAQQAAEFNAQRALEESAIREKQIREEARLTQATGRANVGASGIELSGSPLDVLAENARQYELSALIERRGGQLEAEAQRKAGKAAKTVANYGTAGTLLTGGVSAARDIIRLKQTGSL